MAAYVAARMNFRGKGLVTLMFSTTLFIPAISISFPIYRLLGGLGPVSYTHLVEEGVEECYIPKLCIQLAAENAVVHGLEPKMGGGRVDIAAEQKDGKIQITVADNGVGVGTDGEIRLPLKMEAGDKSHNHVGINNADSRCV